MVATSPSIPKLHVPDDLTELDQWVLWRYEARQGKPTKVPYQTSGNRADSTNPSTWTTFEKVLNVWCCHRQRYAGLGFVFSNEDTLVGIDLDDSLDEQGDVKAWARGIVERFSDTYMEISPSGQGLKIWARGSLPANLPGAPVGDGAIELYDHARYFAVTGRAFRGAPASGRGSRERSAAVVRPANRRQKGLAASAITRRADSPRPTAQYTR